jgi:hypothetical protein
MHLRVPDVARRVGLVLSRADLRAMKERQESLFPGTTDLYRAANWK